MKKPPRKKQPARASLPHGNVVARCPEFTLYERIEVLAADRAAYESFCQRTGRTPKARGGRARAVTVLCVESSPDVDRALVRALMRTNKAAGAADRERMRLGLWNLMLLAARRFPGDPDAFRDQLLDDLADTIGKTLLAALGPAFDWQDERGRKAGGRKRRIDEASKKAGRVLSRAVADVETAAASLARFRADIPMPGDDSPGAWTWMLQHTAKEIFRETRERPTKTQIRIALKDEGWTFEGHDPAENWRRVFETAGLDGLPR